MHKLLKLSVTSVVLLSVTTGCSLFDLSYDSRTTEVKEDTGAESRIEAMERRIERLERDLDNRR